MSKESIKKFQDDRIEHIEADVEKIQKKPSMYISSIGSKGVTQLFKEIVNNSIDESINPKSPCDEIKITIDMEENSILVSDNGRGIPPEDMEVSCTKIQAGSKFTREQSGTSAGENGLGLTAINGLSELFIMTTERYGEKHILECVNGHPKDKIKKSKSKSIDSGLTIKCVPSPIYLGKCDIDYKEIKEWMDKISYLIPHGLKIHFSVVSGKTKLIPKIVYQNKNGMKDYIKSKNIEFDFGISHLESSTTVREELRETFLDKNNNPQVSTRMVKRDVILEFSFSYSSNLSEFQTDSFCNYINTIDGGTHVDAVRGSFVNFITKEVKSSMSEREFEKLELQNSDIIKGLYLVLNLRTDLQPQFSGQTKQKITSDDLGRPIRRMVTDALGIYFTEEQNTLKKILAFVKLNAKTRVEAGKIRNAVIKGETTNLTEHSIPKFVPANSRGKNDYRELILIEGDSALGSSRLGRFDNNSQAVFALRGVPKNTFSDSLDKVLMNEEFKNLVRVLKTNIGEKFDIRKLHYDKIIIMADADIDGHHITSLICTFFLVHLPELVKAGKIYKAVSPLYKLKDSEHEYALNKRDYIQIFEKRIRNSISLTNPKIKKILSKEQIIDFLDINKDYLEELDTVSKQFVLSPIIVEKLAYAIAQHGDKFVQPFNKLFKEITIDKDMNLSGVHEGKYQLCKIDDIFLTSIEPIVNIFKENTSLEYDVTEIISSKNKNHIGLMNVGEIMRRCQKYQPLIETRFKGLGELNPVQLRETTLDPGNRILIQLNISDMEEAISRFAVIHGAESEIRKEMMRVFKINKDDIDN